MPSKKEILGEIEAYLREELAEVDGVRRAEIEKLLVMYRFLPSREYGAEDPVIPSSLVELEHGSVRMFCLVVPQGGGLVMRVSGQPVQVVTPQSPLGEALVGRRVGDLVRVELRGGSREYRVVGVS